MRLLPNDKNVGVAHGEWGENVAVNYLRCRGYEIVDRNPHPVERDRRLEIDIVAWDRKLDVMVFVEVKQQSSFSQFARRLRRVNRRKKDNLRRACNAWRRINRWRGAFRFDVIEVYGVPEGGQPIVDHIRNVELFAKPGRFVQWSELDG